MAETWLLNENIPTQSATFTVNFTSNGNSYSKIKWTDLATPSKPYYGFYDDVGVYSDTSTWTNNAYRTITFETAPTGDLLTWLQANGTKQSNKLSVDLTTLSGWANLADGDHQITIVAKGTGYRDSNPSTPITVTKGVAKHKLIFSGDGIYEVQVNGNAVQSGYSLNDGDRITATGYASATVTINGSNITVGDTLNISNSDITVVATRSGFAPQVTLFTINYSEGAAVYTDCLTFAGEDSEFTLSVGNVGAKEWDGTLYYSTDHNTWNVWDGTAISSANKKLYLRGKGNTKFRTSMGARLWLSANASCSGNIQTLLDYENPPTSIPSDNCYENMFNNCTKLLTSPELSAITLSKSCYYGMFYGCIRLTTAPALPSDMLTENCYNGMFSGCSKLKVNTSSGNKIFTCPSSIPSSAVYNMFGSTGGTFTGTPTAGNTYYWTE